MTCRTLREGRAALGSASTITTRVSDNAHLAATVAASLTAVLPARRSARLRAERLTWRATVSGSSLLRSVSRPVVISDASVCELANPPIDATSGHPGDGHG